MSQAALTLADRLVEEPTFDTPGATDVLGALLSQGYVTSAAPGISDTTLEEIGGRGQVVVTIGGAIDQLEPPSASFLQPFVTQLIAAGVVTGAGESLAGDDGFVAGLRATADSSSGAPLVTVDNVDQPVGGSAMVLAMSEAITQGTGGDYGVKDGASRLLPPAA
jgi:hypothetical protein